MITVPTAPFTLRAHICPTCRSPGSTIDSRTCSNGTRRRRLECRQCGERWTLHQGQPPGHQGGLTQGQRLSYRRITEAEARAILTATGSAKAIARLVGRSRPTVTAILTGQWHADLAPELPRRSASNCERCIHWSGRCGLEVPVEDAVDCVSFWEV